ncbi:MAG: signal peptidase I [Ruminococcaceae bacterium]|nr:signal peptidase I [Oscillospiraceae bacterium]
MNRDKKILYFVSSLITVVLLSLQFVPSSHIRIVSAIVILALCIITVRSVRKRAIYSKNKDMAFLIVGVGTLLYLVLYYLSGLSLGFYKSPTPLTLNSLLTCILPISVIIITVEIVRGVLRAQNSKLVDILSYVGGVLSEIVIFGSAADVESFNQFMDFVGLIIFPALISNVLFHYVSKLYGFMPNIVYRLLITLYPYFIFAVPDVADSLQAFSKIIVPVALYLFLHTLYERKVRYASRKESKLPIIGLVLSLLLMTSTIMLISGQFRFSALVIATESMSGELEVGDVVIFEEYDDQIIKEGQVIVFKKGNIRVVHRVVDIENYGGERRYITKGDSNKDEDIGYILDTDIIGVTSFKIPYIGHPTLWVRDIFSK